MRYIHNPKEANAPIKTVYDGAIYEMKPGQTLAFTEDQYDLADYFLNTYGFLKELDQKKVAKKKVGKLICPICGRECKSQLGYNAHVKACERRHQKKKEEVVEEEGGIENVAEAKPKKVLVAPKKIDRSAAEDEGFVDMPQLARGKAVKEVIGGRVQEVVYDKDGVGWYGPGIQRDFVPSFGPTKKHGRF